MPTDLTFHMRGENMTRIETFVAASFGFAITMLIISVNDIPKGIEEFILAFKNVPSFICSCAAIIFIWYKHANWSRRFGLEDPMTIFLSGTLIIIVLIFIYPLRLMMQGLFFIITDGYFPLGINLDSFENLRTVFTFYGVGFLVLTINFWALHAHALNQGKALSLNAFEYNYTQRNVTDWFISAAMSLVVIAIMILAPVEYLIYVPHLFFLLFAKSFFVKRYYDRKLRNINVSTQTIDN